MSAYASHVRADMRFAVVGLTRNQLPRCSSKRASVSRWVTRRERFDRCLLDNVRSSFALDIRLGAARETQRLARPILAVQQLPQDIVEDAAVDVVTHFLRRNDAH